MKNKLTLFQQKKEILCVKVMFVFFLATGINYSSCNYVFDLSGMSLGKWPLYFASSLLGSLFIVGVSQFLPEIKILQSFGKNIMNYYGLHYEVLGALKILPIFSDGTMLMGLVVFALLFPIITLYKKFISYIKRGVN